MNLDTPTTVLTIAGALLIYSSVKNKWPHDVVLEAIGKKGSGKPIMRRGGLDGDPDTTGKIIPIPGRGASGGGGGRPPMFTDNPLGNAVPLYIPNV
jgi:hypothetical protein